MRQRVPTCTADRRRHDWRRVQDGVWGIGGAAVAETCRCPHCGLRRQTVMGDLREPSTNRNGMTYFDTDGAPLET
jgi:hypothetical protein